MPPGRPTHRVVVGLNSAQLALRPPWPSPRGAKGAKAAGHRYERALAAEVPYAIHGLWVEFSDINGRGFCQPDLVIKDVAHAGRTHTVVLESKITWTPNGHGQVAELYAPVLERLWGQPVVGVVVCKHLTPEVPLSWVHGDLAAAVAAALGGRQSVWHWLGR